MISLTVLVIPFCSSGYSTGWLLNLSSVFTTSDDHIPLFRPLPTISSFSFPHFPFLVSAFLVF